jgi:tetratricopeptide (TPR) repeat protein
VLSLRLEQGATIASFHPPSVVTAVGVLALCSLVVGGLATQRGTAQGRLALFGCAWFLLALLPHVVSLPVIGLWGNRYGYFPLLGLCVTLASALWRAETYSKPLLRRAAIGALFVCVLLSLAQTRLAAASFHDDLALYEASVVADPDDGRALYHYAHAVRERSGCSGALGFLLRATQLDPGYARAQRNLAACLLDLGEPARAVQPAERAVALEPQVASHRYNLAAALIGAGQRARGVAQLKQALALDPSHAAARRLLASLGEQ